jgi:predicted HTH domain antitoxin
MSQDFASRGERCCATKPSKSNRTEEDVRAVARAIHVRYDCGSRLDTAKQSFGAKAVITVNLDLDDELVAFLRRQDGTIEDVARELMVMELYRRGAVSRGKAAELLGMPLVEFLRRANELGIPYFNYSDEEFAAELAASKRW